MFCFSKYIYPIHFVCEQLQLAFFIVPVVIAIQIHDFSLRSWCLTGRKKKEKEVKKVDLGDVSKKMEVMMIIIMMMMMMMMMMMTMVMMVAAVMVVMIA